MIIPLFLALTFVQQSVPTQAEGNLRTRWGEEVYQTYLPDNRVKVKEGGQALPTPLNEYPRPQMVRKNWTNLNGEWTLKIGDGTETTVIVPYPVESQLSQVQQRVPEGAAMVYTRTFTRPAGERVLLNFGAVDWDATVKVNGTKVGSHKGGYDGFSFDITDALTPSGDQKVEVTVLDPTDKGLQPRGKQVADPKGIFYTPSSGIWQTVWLEGVNRPHLDRTWSMGDTKGAAWIKTEGASCTGYRLVARILDDGRVVAQGEGKVGTPLKVTVANPKLWSPASAYLYPLRLAVLDNAGKEVDDIQSYIAFRQVSVGKAPDGKTRILVNGKPLFLVGPLDQGFWPDGLYTAPTDEALRYDIEVTKRLGFNAIRKHVKVEPERWYYWCDKLGIAVLQDMPSMSGFIGGNDADLNVETPVANQYIYELRRMIETHRSHPSILMWIPFNEGWGQHDTDLVVKFVKTLDSSRLVDDASGWTDRGVGDVHDIHVYPGPASPQPETNRAAMLGEFGGLGLVVEGHMWKPTGWGYQSFTTSDELTDRFVGIFDSLHFLVGNPGLSAAIYTQTTDVETESNGLMTYDRAILKMDEDKVKAAVLALQTPPPTLKTILPTSEARPQTWWYRTEQPAETWTSPLESFTGWQTGAGGFGTKGTPGAFVNTAWNTPDIWLRRIFETSEAADVRLYIHHDENAQVYIDGQLVADLEGFTSGYVMDSHPIHLEPGKHVMAIHCHQTTGGQYIDAGLVQIVSK